MINSELKTDITSISCVQQISVLRKVHGSASDVIKEPMALSTDPESINGSIQRDFKLNIEPSNQSLTTDQQNDLPKAPPRNCGLFGGIISENVYCAFIVALAILLINWI